MLVKLLKKCVAQVITMLVRWGWPRLGSRLMLVLGQPVSTNRPRLMILMSVAEGAVQLSAKVRSVIPARPLALLPIRRAGTYVDGENIDRQVHQVFLPAVGITEFCDIQIIGGSEMLCTEAGTLLYDEMALGDPDRYGCKAFGIIPAQGFCRHLPACKNGRVLISHHYPEKAPIARGIHLCKDHSGNYFHWLFECLPRAIMAMARAEYAGFPLLVDAHLPEQNLQALEQISAGREIIRIGHRDLHRVGELVFPGVFSFMRDNYGSDVSPGDLLIAPEAVSLLRQTYVPNLVTSGNRKLFVARDGAQYRRLLNEKQLQKAMGALGFEIVRPEGLSFAQQVELFSAASVIIGPTGAGLSNMAFAPEGCKVIVLAGATRGANTFIFGQLGQLLKHGLVYLTGPARHSGKLHSDYTIDLDELRELLTEMQITSRAGKAGTA